jgi:hypothetical protein
MKNDRLKNDHIKSDRIKSGRIKSDRIKTDRIKRITDLFGLTHNTNSTKMQKSFVKYRYLV